MVLLGLVFLGFLCCVLFPEAIVSELLNYRVSLAGLTETRLVDNGVQYIDSCTLLHSGGSSHINGVALLLDKRLSGSGILESNL